MGKKTKIHPVPLATIRGGAEYCGFKFDRIVQQDYDEYKQLAVYWASISQFPGDKAADVVSPRWLLMKLDECFSRDVSFREALWSKGKWSVILWTMRLPDSHAENPES